MTKTLNMIYQDCTAHDVLKHDLLIDIGKGLVNTKGMAHIIKAYVTYSVEFPSLINNIIKQWTWHPDTMLLLSQLLKEEKDLDGKTHAEQLASCADSLGVHYDSDILDRMALYCKEYAVQINSMIEKGKSFSLGIIGPGTENVVPILYKPFLFWLQSSAPDSDNTFFREHAVIDIKHSSLLKTCIENEVKDNVELHEGAMYALNQRKILFDKLYMELQHSGWLNGTA